MSWKRKVALGFAVPLVLLVLFLVVEHFRGTWALARWKARIAAKGEPLTIVAAMPPPVHANEDGMPALLSAAAQTGPFPWKLRPPAYMNAGSGNVVVITAVSEWPASGRPRTNINWDAVSQALQMREDALANAVKALEYRKFNGQLDYYAGWSSRLRNFPQFYHLSRYLCAAALNAFHRGNTDAGTEFLEAAIRLDGAPENEALLLSQLVRMTIAQDAFESTWQAANSSGLQEQHLKRLQDAWAEQEFLRPMKGAFAMERAIISHEFQRFRDGDVPLGKWVYLNGSSWPPAGPINSPLALLVTIIERTPEFLRNGVYTPVWKFAWSHQDELEALKKVQHGLDAWDAAIACQSSWPVKNFGQWEYQGMDEPTDPDPRQNFYDRMRYIISPRAHRFYPGMKRAFCEQTLRELALTGLALQRYRLRFGHPPEKLEQLVPEILPSLPRDFMNGQVLQYRNGRLYSVGLDGEDNGGDVAKVRLNGFNFVSGKDLLWAEKASPEEVKARFETGD